MLRMQTTDSGMQLLYCNQPKMSCDSVSSFLSMIPTAILNVYTVPTDCLSSSTYVHEILLTFVSEPGLES